MKKFLIVVLAAFLCLAFTLPAVAAVKVGGMVTLDWTYLSEDEERSVRGVSSGDTTTSNGFDRTDFTVPVPLNRFNVRYTSDDGALSGFIEVRGGGSTDAGSTTGYFNYAYIQWQVTPTQQVTFGRQTTAFARFIPHQWVGTGAGSIVGVGFGNVHHATSRTGIKGYWRISDMIGLVWGLFDAEVVGPSTGLTLASAGGVAVVTSPTPENKLPRVDLALPIRFPWGRIEPSFTWSTTEYDQIPGGSDDSYDSYGVSLGGTGSWGMFVLEAEVTYGQNLGASSYRGAEGAVPVVYTPSGTSVQKIEDGEVLAWFIDVGFKFGPNRIDLYYSTIAYENDGDPAVGDASDPASYDYEQTMYGISWAIGVAKGFTIRPELNFYDFDEDARKLGSTSPINEGKSWLLGLQFQLVF